jgi:hypothetical protein
MNPAFKTPASHYAQGIRSSSLSRSIVVVGVFVAAVVFMAEAAAIEVRRARIVIDFPVKPSNDDGVENSPLGPISRHAAVAVTRTCDYALFEFSYPPGYLERVGEESVLPLAVSESMARYQADVQSLERGSRSGYSLVDLGFRSRGKKSEGQARYLHVDTMVYEATVLCLPGERADPRFLRSLRVR